MLAPKFEVSVASKMGPPASPKNGAHHCWLSQSHPESGSKQGAENPVFVLTLGDDAGAQMLALKATRMFLVLTRPHVMESPLPLPSESSCTFN